MFNKIKKSLITNQGGIDHYFAVGICIVLFMFFLSASLQAITLFHAQNQIQTAAKEISKTIQISGVIDNQTIAVLNENLENTNIKDYSASVVVENGNKTITFNAHTTDIKNTIQLNTNYEVTISGHVKYFGKDKAITANSSGISETYHK